MRLTLFSVWTGIWIAISGVGIISAVGIYFVSKDQVEVNDYMPGSNLNADYWRGGEFLGYKATKIRRLEHARGFPVFKDRIYYVEVPITPADLEQKMTQLKSEPSARFNKRCFEDEALYKHRPSWFTVPTLNDYMGEIIDSSGWRVNIFKGQTNDCIHLIVY